VLGTRESRGCPVHEEQQSVDTIYPRPVCFRNGDNNLRAMMDVVGQPAREANM